MPALPEGKSRGLHILNWIVGILFVVLVGLPTLGFGLAAIGSCDGGFSETLTCSVGFLAGPAEFFGMLAIIFALSGGVFLVGLLVFILSIVAFILEIRHVKRAGRPLSSALRSVSFIILLLTGVAILYFFIS